MTGANVDLPRWTPAILDAIEPIIEEWQLPVHDPFANEGLRLGALCDRLGLAFTGTEIEPEYIIDFRVDPGDSTMPLTYPARPFATVTSPAYPNGWTDHFHAQDGSRRHTYRQALAAITGEDRPLHPNNMGRHGVRSGRRAEARHFAIAERCVAHWSDHVIVNVSDFITDGQRWPLVQRWHRLLDDAGYRVTESVPVKTPRQRNGANASARVEDEMVIIARRDPYVAPGAPQTRWVG